MVAPLTAPHDKFAELLAALLTTKFVGAAHEAGRVVKLAVVEFAEQLAFTCQLYAVLALSPEIVYVFVVSVVAVVQVVAVAVLWVLSLA